MLPRFSTLSLVLALCLHTGLAQECDDGYELFPSFPGSRYKLPPFYLDWAHALASCQSDGGGSHLLVINSDQEAEVVKTLMTRLNGTGLPNPWVGINDLATEGAWRTVMGDLVTESGYNKWDGVEPDGGVDENCGIVISYAVYRDTVCSLVRPFICEKPN